jgi:hypothetical protein
MNAETPLCDCERCMPAPSDTLIRRCLEAAAAAILNERPALSHAPETVKGLTVELTLKSDGQINEAIVYVERRTTGGALLGRQVKGGQG